MGNQNHQQQKKINYLFFQSWLNILINLHNKRHRRRRRCRRHCCHHNKKLEKNRRKKMLQQT